MTDARLHRLERAWTASGTVEDEARYLHERVRSGDLPPERLELAAYCGHSAARRTLGALEVPGRLYPRVAGLARWGRAVMVRACHAALAESFRATRDTVEGRAVRAVETWLGESPGATVDVLEAWRELHEEYEYGPFMNLEGRNLFAVRYADATVCMCRAVIGQGWSSSAVQAFRHLADPFGGWEAAERALQTWALDGGR